MVYFILTERSRQSARECRARKKLRYQYLEELVSDREKAVISLRGELEKVFSKKIPSVSISRKALTRTLFIYLSVSSIRSRIRRRPFSRRNARSLGRSWCNEARIKLFAHNAMTLIEAIVLSDYLNHQWKIIQNFLPILLSYFLLFRNIEFDSTFVSLLLDFRNERIEFL